MNKFYLIPAGSVLVPEPNAQDIYIKQDIFRAWYRETRTIDEVEVPVVVLVGSEYSVVRDGSWSSQLDSCVGGCDGGGVIPTPAGEQRVAYGGIYQPEPTGYDEVRFPAPGEWVTLTSDVVDLVGYAGEATDEVVYDLDENSMMLDWVSPVPTGRQFAQFTIFWSVAAVGNDQTYEFGVLSNGTDVTAPSGRAVLSYERAGDVETLAQQGQALVENGDKVQLIVRNVNGTNPLRLFTVNARMTVSAQSDPV